MSFVHDKKFGQKNPHVLAVRHNRSTPTSVVKKHTEIQPDEADKVGARARTMNAMAGREREKKTASERVREL